MNHQWGLLSFLSSPSHHLFPSLIPSLPLGWRGVDVLVVIVVIVVVLVLVLMPVVVVVLVVVLVVILVVVLAVLVIVACSYS